MDQNCQNGSECLKNGPIWYNIGSKMVQNGPSQSKIVQNGPNAPKCFNIVTHKNGQTQFKMVQNGH